MSSQVPDKETLPMTQEITLKLPRSFDIPIDYLETTPHENAAILLFGRSLLTQLRRENYNEHLLSLEEELKKERTSTERFRNTLDSVAEGIDQSIERVVSRSFERLSADVKDLSTGVLEEDKKERDATVSMIHQQEEAFERRVAGLNLLLDRVGEIEKRQLERVTPHMTNTARGRENEMDSRQLILKSFGSNGSGFRFHPKQDFSGDHVFEWNGLRIMWEDKDYAASVPRAEVEKAWRDIAANPDCHVLIFVSARSGISTREGASGLFSEVRDGQLIIYLSNFKQNADQILFLNTIVQTILAGVKPLLLTQSGEITDERISLAVCGLGSLSQSLGEMQRMCENLISEFRVKLSTMKGSIDRTRSGMDALIQSISSSASPTSEPTKAQRKCSKCGRPGHTSKTCTA
jgi:hypothetical protein